MFNLPNAITVSRILLVPVFALMFVLPGAPGPRLIAFAIFCIAGASDALDGLAARKLNAGSEFGRMLDPIADKILVAVALMMLVAEGTIHQFNLDLTPGVALRSLLKLVPALVILSREILVSGLREFLAGAAVSVPVTRIAKVKTTIQMIAIGAMILDPLAWRWLPGNAAVTYSCVAYGGLWLAAALTVGTGYAYFRAGLAHLHSASGPRAARSKRFARAPCRRGGVKLLYFAWVRQKLGRSEERFCACLPRVAHHANSWPAICAIAAGPTLRCSRIPNACAPP